MRATAPAEVDGLVGVVASRAAKWVEIPPGEKAEMLRNVARRFHEVSADLVADALAAKSLPSSYGGEDWVSGPISVLRTCRFLADTIESIARTGRVPLSERAITTNSNGQVSVSLMPGDGWDRLLYPRWTAHTWLMPGIPRSQARDHLGSFYTKPEVHSPGVAAILGAGNVASIAPLDLVHKLFVDGRVAVLKFSPVNQYIGPYVEHAFADLAAGDFVRFAYGDASVGAALVDHPQITEVHITGSEDTHDAIVFGAGDEGARRKANRDPRLNKVITSELGNVSPVIVVPGRWRSRDIQAQARHVATQLVQNAGFNCNAIKVLIVPESWDQRNDFLDAVAGLLSTRPPRMSYYPGAQERYEAALVGAPRVRAMGSVGDGVIPPTMLAGLTADDDIAAFGREAFCQVMAVVDVSGDDPGAYLRRAVDFCNERLRGTLNATILVDPHTAGESDTGLTQAVEQLRYGSVGVNVWAAAAFPLGVTPWGAYPGHSLHDIQSGTGFVHNARLIDSPHKTVMTAPFRMFPPPPWSVFHRRSTEALRRVADFEARPSVRTFASVLGPALRP